MPFRQYNDAKSAYLKLKDEKNELGIKVRKLQKKNSPITRLKECVCLEYHDLISHTCTRRELDEKHKEIDQQREVKKSATKAKYLAMKKLWQQNDALVRCLIRRIIINGTNILAFRRKKMPMITRAGLTI